MYFLKIQCLILKPYKHHQSQNFELKIEPKKQNTLQMILHEFEIDICCYQIDIKNVLANFGIYQLEQIAKKQ